MRWLRRPVLAALAALALCTVALASIAYSHHLQLGSVVLSRLRRKVGYTLDPRAIPDAPRRRVLWLGMLQNTKLDELSGLALSRRSNDLLWALNDSGDGPTLYAIGSDGRDRGSVRVRGAENVDWEDLAGFELDGRAYLLIADTGDNLAWRPAVTLYIVPEPRLDAARFAPDASVAPEWVLRARFPDGPTDCEAVAVDTASRRILLVSKRTVPPVLYALPLAPRHDAIDAVDDVLTAQRLGPLPGIARPSARDRRFGPAVGLGAGSPTSMDIAPDGSQAIVLTYKHAFLFEHRAGESWAHAFGGVPQRVRMPPMQGAEAIAFGRDGRTLYASSEALPTPLFRLDAPPAADGPAQGSVYHAGAR